MDCVTSMASKRVAGREREGWHAAGPCPSFGVIIANRDRSQVLDACLGSLAVQETQPAWVMLSDLDSQQPHRAELTALAERYLVSYLRIDHDGPWNKSLAFNTAFRLALCSLPAVSHVIQLDADMILHPRLLRHAAAELRNVSCFCCASRPAPPGLEHWVPGEAAGFERILAQCGRTTTLGVGGFLVLPCGWLAGQRGFDEAFTGWGHEDSELWWRARKSLTYGQDTTGRMLIHQWHERQPDAGQAGPNRMLFMRRIANPGEANPAGWGDGRIAEAALRSGLIRVPGPESRAAQPSRPT